MVPTRSEKKAPGADPDLELEPRLGQRGDQRLDPQEERRLLQVGGDDQDALHGDVPLAVLTVYPEKPRGEVHLSKGPPPERRRCFMTCSVGPLLTGWAFSSHLITPNRASNKET